MKRVKDVLAELAPVSDYERGYIAAMTDLAVWKDGQQLVGVLRKPLAEAVEEFLLEGRERTAL